MFAIILGLIFIGFTVIACLPFGLNWGAEIITVLKGGAPLFSAFLGLIAFAIGYADIKDKKTAKNERENIRKNEKVITNNSQSSEANEN